MSEGMLGQAVKEAEVWKSSSLGVSEGTDPWGASQWVAWVAKANGDLRSREVPPLTTTIFTRTYPAYF